MSLDELHFYEGKHELERGQLCPPKNRKEERRQTMGKKLTNMSCILTQSQIFYSEFNSVLTDFFLTVALILHICVAC